jgi:hypothetical protein
MKMVLMAAGALLLAAPLAPALAHDDDDEGYRGYSAHSRYHDALEEAHARAHEEGFSSSREHRAYHRALRDLHDEYHEGHSYGYNRPYYYRPYYYRRRPGVSFYFGF